MRKYYSIAELEEHTSIPDSTIRRYIKSFSDFFVFQGGGRVKKYEDSAVKVLIRIKQLYDNGLGTNEVNRTLKDEFPLVVNVGDDEVETTSNAPALPTAQEVAEIKESQKRQEENIKLLIEKVDNQERYIKESMEKRDQQLMEATRLLIERKKEVAAATEPKEEKKGFWARFFGR